MTTYLVCIPDLVYRCIQVHQLRHGDDPNKKIRIAYEASIIGLDSLLILGELGCNIFGRTSLAVNPNGILFLGGAKLIRVAIMSIHQGVGVYQLCRSEKTTGTEKVIAVANAMLSGAIGAFDAGTHIFGTATAVSVFSKSFIVQNMALLLSAGVEQVLLDKNWRVIKERGQSIIENIKELWRKRNSSSKPSSAASQAAAPPPTYPFKGDFMDPSRREARRLTRELCKTDPCRILHFIETRFNPLPVIYQKWYDALLADNPISSLNSRDDLLSPIKFDVVAIFQDYYEDLASVNGTSVEIEQEKLAAQYASWVIEHSEDTDIFIIAEASDASHEPTHSAASACTPADAAAS